MQTITEEDFVQYRAMREEIEVLKRQLREARTKSVADTVRGSGKEYPYTEHTVTIIGYDAVSYTHLDVYKRQELYVTWRNMDDYEPYVPMEITPRELCVFQHGKGGQRFVHGWEWGRGEWQERWKHRKECKSGFAPGAGPFSGGIQTVLDQESFTEAVQGTPFAPIVMGDAGNISVSNAWDYYDRIKMCIRDRP